MVRMLKRAALESLGGQRRGCPGFEEGVHPPVALPRETLVIAEPLWSLVNGFTLGFSMEGKIRQ